MITVTFKCGHTRIASGNETELSCALCGETDVERVNAPAPRFTGHVRGPHAAFKDLPAKAVTFGEGEKS